MGRYLRLSKPAWTLFAAGLLANDTNPERRGFDVTSVQNAVLGSVGLSGNGLYCCGASACFTSQSYRASNAPARV